jgi:ribose transport system permease protein
VRKFLAKDGVAIGVFLVVVIAIFSFLNPAFLSLNNFGNVAVQSAFILILAVGTTFVLTAGGIDLSIGALLGFCGGVTMFVLTEGHWFGFAILAGLGTGVVFGLLNGFLVARLGLNDFIVTLGTMSVAAGGLRLLDSIRPLRVERVVEDADAFTSLAHGTILGIPGIIVFSVFLVVGLQIVLRRSPFGRRVSASGMRRSASELAGINVAKIRMIVFVMSGLLAAVAGVLMASRLSSVPARLGLGFELQAIAAAVLGGTSLFGGRGTVIGTALAALLLGTINAGLQIGGIDATWYKVVLGLSIILAVAFHEWTARYARTQVDYSASTGGNPAWRERQVDSANSVNSDTKE